MKRNCYSSKEALRAKHTKKGTIVTKEDIAALRPCPVDGLSPVHIKKIQGKS